MFFNGKIPLVFSFLSYLDAALFLVGLFQESIYYSHLGRNQTFSPCHSQEEGAGHLGLLLGDLCVALQGLMSIDGGGHGVGVKVL